MENTTLMAVDDDAHILDILNRYFSPKGYTVKTYDDPQKALAEFSEGEFDLVILDLNMPGMDGFTLCREIRQRSQVPIIMLTAEDTETDRVVGLELGADDYVAKPFSNRELEARIKARLRNRATQATTQPNVAEESGSLRFDSFTLDPDRHELLDKNGDIVPLTGGEYRLLKTFVDHPNRVISRDQLMDWTKGHESGPFDRSIDVQVGRLRKKLGDSGPDYRLLKTFRGEGYLFSAKVSSE